MTVIVDGKRYEHVSAIGVGHIRKDLVLVFPAVKDDSGVVVVQERAEKCGTDWVRFEVER